MLEILRDPVWQFVGAMLALLAIAVTIWAYFAQRPRKRLLVERVARVPLITVGADRIPGLQITIDGHQIERATVVVVLVRNLGNAPLAAKDFESSLTLDFEVGSVVLDAQISGSTPEHLPVMYSCLYFFRMNSRKFRQAGVPSLSRVNRQFHYDQLYAPCASGPYLQSPRGSRLRRQKK